MRAVGKSLSASARSRVLGRLGLLAQNSFNEVLVTGDPWQKCLLLAGAETEPCQRPKNEAANISGEKKPPSRLPPKDLLGTEDPAMHDIKDGKYDVIV